MTRLNWSWDHHSSLSFQSIPGCHGRFVEDRILRTGRATKKAMIKVGVSEYETNDRVTTSEYL